MTPSANIRILIVQANPPDTPEFGAEVEQRNLDAALWNSLNRNLFDRPAFAPAARVGDLLAALRRHQPHIFHVMAHGDGRGGLLLHAPGDEEFQILPATALAEQLQAYQAEAADPVRLTVLAGCYTAETAQLLSASCGCVIGMDGAIEDYAVRDAFTPALYAALGDGRSVQNALESALAELRSHLYDDDAGMVRLFTMPGVDAAQDKAVAWSRPHAQLSGLHLEYLRSWFGQPWVTVSLADILEERAEHASLLDLYAPLPVNCKIVVQTQAHQVIDWWVKRDGPEERATEEALSQVLGKGLASEQPELALSKVRRWAELDVDEPELQAIVNGIQHKIQTRQAAGQSTDDSEHVWFMEAHDAASVQPRFVLLGDPGSGKSSFLRHLALCLAGELRRRAGDAGAPANASLAALRDWLLDAYTPLYIELRSLVRDLFPGLPADATRPAPLPTSEHLWRYVREQVLGPGLAGFETALRGLFAQGQAILLLDGLDEIPQADDPRRREQVKAFITALAGSYPALRMIVAGRPYAYRVGEWSLPDFGHTTLQPLSVSRLQELAQALFAIATPGRAAEEATAFVEAVRSHPHMEPRFHANPLFFTLLAALWLEAPDRRLPETEAELYRRAVDLLLDRWTRRRAPDPPVADSLGLSAAELRSVLETLACTVHEQAAPGQDTTVFHGKELLGILLDAGFQVRIQDVPHYLEQHAGLLVSPARNLFYFSHRSFQEHLAACELTCREPSRRRPPVAADRHFPHGLIRRAQERPDLWRNVALLAADELAAQGRGDELWRLLIACCRPYLEQGEALGAAPLALAIARRHQLFAGGEDLLHDVLLTLLRRAARQILTDVTQFPPEDRNLAGELLGERPEHDDRPGVGLRLDGLPDIDWVMIPEVDENGRREFVYGQDERRIEPTFWIARHPITYAQFQPFLDSADGFDNPQWWEGLATPAEQRAKPGEQRFRFWNHPRENVSWWDAIAFCRWLTAKAQATPGLLPEALRNQSGWRITLPTEWQWEKAARGHDGRRYPWGGEAYQPGHANIDETAGQIGPHYLQKSSAVGMYPQGASPYDVLDLSGNVWEWCLNEYEHPDRTQEAGDARRVLRGGSWYFNHVNAAAPVRIRFFLPPRDGLFGFRVVVCSVPVG